MESILIQGKAKDWCSKCKNGTCYLKDSDTYICTDPYDNEERAIGAQTDIECTMFEPDSGRYPWGHCDTKMNVIYEDDKVRAIKVTGWGDEKRIPKGDIRIEELIKASKRKDELIQNYREQLEELENDYNANAVETKRLKEANENLLEKCKVYIDEKADLKLNVENLQSNINFQKYLKDEAYKREDELKKELKKVKSHDEALTKHFQNDEKLIDNIQKVIFPQEEGSDYAYSYDEILNKVKELKVQSDENGTMYKDLKYWKERCHNAEFDVTTLNSKVEVLDKRNNNQFVMIGDRDKEIEELKKMVERRDRWVNDLQSDVYTLQNEILTIRNIAQKAYDDTNRD